MLFTELHPEPKSVTGTEVDALGIAHDREEATTSNHPARVPLGTRLRELRQTQWPDVKLRQPDVAEALGVAVSSISTWEGSSGKQPPLDRLHKIATFFATRRSIDDDKPRVLSEDDLSSDERVVRDRLFRELAALHSATPQTAATPPFPEAGDHPLRLDGGPVRLVCGALPPEDRSRYADPDDRNHMAASALGDLDALIEVFAEMRRLNPNADVRYLTQDEINADELQYHLVLLGNLAWAQNAGRLFMPRKVPVRQIADTEIDDGEIFEIDGPDGIDTIRPVIGPDGKVTEDVAFFLRTRSPINRERTLTICSGVFTRGVLAAARLLQDPEVGAANATYVTEKLKSASTYGVLVRAFVFGGATVTPSLSDEDNRLFEFSMPL